MLGSPESRDSAASPTLFLSLLFISVPPDGDEPTSHAALPPTKTGCHSGSPVQPSLRRFSLDHPWEGSHCSGDNYKPIDLEKARTIRS